MKTLLTGAVLILSLPLSVQAQTLPDAKAAATAAGLCPGRVVAAASYLPDGRLSVTCSATRAGGAGAGFAPGIAPAVFGLLLAGLGASGSTGSTGSTGGE